MAVQPGPAGAAGGAARGRPAGLHRRSLRPGPRHVRARVRHRHPGPERGSSATWRSTGTCSSWARPRRGTRRSRTASSTSASPSTRRRGHPEALQAGDAVPGRALGDAARRVGPLDRAVRANAGCVLPGRRHGDRPAGGADGQRGLVPGERARPGDERRRGRLSRVVPAPAHRQRVLRDPEPRPRARQQLLHRRAQPGNVLPGAGLGPADRHVRRALDDRRLQGAHRRPAPVRRRLVVRGRHDRHRRAARLPHARPVGQLDEGPADRAVPAHLRAADLSEEPVPRPRADDARRVPQGSHPAADRAAW